jgi:hypothetical protein
LSKSDSEWWDLNFRQTMSTGSEPVIDSGVLVLRGKRAAGLVVAHPDDLEYGTTDDVARFRVTVEVRVRTGDVVALDQRVTQ